MTAEKSVEARIRDHYCADNGEWLVEKGKVKEARLLKEAFHRINSLKNDASMYSGWYNQEKNKRVELEKSLEAREKALADREERFARRIEDFKNVITSWQK